MRPTRQKSNFSNGTEVLAARIAAVQVECHRAVIVLSGRRPLSEAKLAECARLGDSLEATHRFLKFAVAHIVIAKRKSQGAEDY